MLDKGQKQSSTLSCDSSYLLFILISYLSHHFHKDLVMKIHVSLFIALLLTEAFILENQQSGFPTRSDTNQAVQSQKQARSLKLQGIVLSVQQNKGTDQMCSFCTADLHLWFCICRFLFFSCKGSNNSK